MWCVGWDNLLLDLCGQCKCLDTWGVCKVVIVALVRLRWDLFEEVEYGYILNSILSLRIAGCEHSWVEWLWLVPMWWLGRHLYGVLSVTSLISGSSTVACTSYSMRLFDRYREMTRLFSLCHCVRPYSYMPSDLKLFHEVEVQLHYFSMSPNWLARKQLGGPWLGKWLNQEMYWFKF